MFEPGSRYAAIETATHTLPDGRVVAYVRRRVCPQGDRMPVAVEVTVTEGDRLDLVTARTLGDPEHFWRVCDANDAMHPAELERPDTVVRVPVPQFEDRS